MRSNYLYFFILLLTLAAVKSESEDEKEQKLAKDISENICKDEVRVSDWFECIMCCQGMNPYKLKQQAEDNSKTRGGLYAGDITGDTKKLSCDYMQDYATKLKEVAVDWKDNIKDCCSTEDGMKDFFQKKMDCFTACEEDPPNKSKCKQ